MRLSMLDAVRLFLRYVTIDQAFPRELKGSHLQTRVTMDAARAMITQRCAGFATNNALFANFGKKSGQSAYVLASGSKMRQSISEELATAYAFWAPWHYAAQGCDAAHCQRRNHWPGMAGPCFEKAPGRSPRMLLGQGLPADLPGRRPHADGAKNSWKSLRPMLLFSIAMQGRSLESGKGSKGGSPAPEDGQ
jgi:hypothetical protein